MSDNIQNARIKAHIQLYREDPKKAHDWNPYGKVVSALLLITKGRKTGKLRSLPLVYTLVDGAFVVVGSKGGAPDHPYWFKNLIADPSAQIQVAEHAYQVRARVAQGAERDRLWAAMVETLPQYEEYQARTDRELPVVVLEPQASRG